MDCDEKARRSSSPSGVTVVRTRSTQAPIRKGITNVQANAAGQTQNGEAEAEQQEDARNQRERRNPDDLSAVRGRMG